MTATASVHESGDIAPLVAWIDEAGELLRSTGLDVKRDGHDEFLLLFGLCAQSVRYAQAWSRLYSSGFEREAIVLARCAVEHAVSAQWCYFTAGGIQQLRDKIVNERRSFYVDFGTWLEHDELLSAATSLPTADGEPWPNFGRTILKEVDAQNFLRTSYRGLSRSAHVSDSTVAGFLEVSDNGYSVNVEPGDPMAFQAAHGASVAAMLGLWVIAEQIEDKSLSDLLDRRSDELELPCSLRDNIPEERARRFDSDVHR